MITLSSGLLARIAWEIYHVPNAKSHVTVDLVIIKLSHANIQHHIHLYPPGLELQCNVIRYIFIADLDVMVCVSFLAISKHISENDNVIQYMFSIDYSSIERYYQLCIVNKL